MRTIFIAVLASCAPVIASADGLVDEVAAIKSEVAMLKAALSGAILASPEPCERLGAGWATYSAAEGKFLLGAGGSYSPEGGEARVTLKTNEIPKHRHKLTYYMSNQNGTGAGFNEQEKTDNRVGRSPPRVRAGLNSSGRWTVENRPGVDYAGGGKSHNNMPPYTAIHFCHLGG